jgi:hypothetical protein
MILPLSSPLHPLPLHHRRFLPLIRQDRASSLQSRALDIEYSLSHTPLWPPQHRLPPPLLLPYSAGPRASRPPPEPSLAFHTISGLQSVRIFTCCPGRHCPVHFASWFHRRRAHRLCLSWAGTAGISEALDGQHTGPPKLPRRMPFRPSNHSKIRVRRLTLL